MIHGQQNSINVQRFYFILACSREYVRIYFFHSRSETRDPWPSTSPMGPSHGLTTPLAVHYKKVHHEKEGVGDKIQDVPSTSTNRGTCPPVHSRIYAHVTGPQIAHHVGLPTGNILAPRPMNLPKIIINKTLHTYDG